MVHFRTLSRADLPFCWMLKTQAGWNQTEQDLRRMLKLAGEGALLAELDGRPAGIVLGIPFDSVGWICMMLVEESLRGQGIGRALMQEAIRWLESQGIESIRLDATPLGRPLYETLGFAAQFELTRFAGQPLNLQYPACPEVTQLASPGEFEALLELDASVTNTNRRALLEQMATEPEATIFIAHDNQSQQGPILIGYLCIRPGSQATFLGPLIASTLTAGQALLYMALRQHIGQPIMIDVPDEHHVAREIVLSAGLTPQRNLTRMTRGRLLHEHLSALWASSGPEKG